MPAKRTRLPRIIPVPDITAGTMSQVLPVVRGQIIRSRKSSKARILTAEEFIQCGETAQDLIVECVRNGHRWNLKGPVRNIRLEQGEHYLKLSWSDSDGDPSVPINSLKDKLKAIPDWSEDEYVYTIRIRS